MITVAKSRDRFSNYLTLALIIHVIVTLALYIFGNINIFKTNHKKIDVIKSSVRVDVVSMPKFTVQELKKMKLVPMSSKEDIKKSQAKKDEKILESKIQEATKKVNLSSLFKNLSKKKVIRAKKNREGKTKVNQYKKELKKLVLEGNKISKGSSTTGSSDYSEQREFNTYVQTLPSIVRPYWKLPSYLLNRDLRCRIQVFISKRGEILNYKIYEPSGDAEFDQRAIDAIKRVKKFPIPPGDIYLRVTSGEVILGFPL